MSQIDREILYEKACDLEAQALSYVGKIANDDTKIEEWRIWSAILAERTAFKHDIFDAPEVKPEPKWIPCSDRLPEDCTEVFVYLFDSPSPYIAWIEDTHWYTEDFEVDREDEPIAWMPLPEQYREEGENQ